MNMHPAMFPPSDVCFATKMYKQYKPPSLSSITNLQVRQSVISIDSNGSCVPSIVAKVVICSISGDLMYLIEGSTNQSHWVKLITFVNLYILSCLSST